MTWPEFLENLRGHHSLTLVGPLNGAPHSPSGPTVYVDGGTKFREPAPSSFPTIALGDGDSGDAMDKSLPAEKDLSDLAFVLRELPVGIHHLNLCGFLGGRRDHELANFGEVHQFLRRRAQSRCDFYAGNLQVIGFCGKVEQEIHGVFSILVLEAVNLVIEGECKYKMDGSLTLEPASSHGLSNEGFGRVRAESSKPAFIFLNANV